VVLADVRDTYFQRDPFPAIPLGVEGFLAFTGVERIPIRECGWNSGWIKDCFSGSVYHDVVDKKILCSGVSLGSMSTVYRYLELMTDVILATGKSDISRDARFPHCERNGVDQGVHNVLLHKQLVPYTKIWEKGLGPVTNLQAQLAKFENGLVLNANEAQPRIVHQYDRIPALQTMLFERYVYWLDTNNLAAEWTATSLCAGFKYHEDVELFQGMCDLKSIGMATSGASCCKHCVKTANCRGFTYYSGNCFLKSCQTLGKHTSLMGAVSAIQESTPTVQIAVHT
jgi:hypothetical protein